MSVHTLSITHAVLSYTCFPILCEQGFVSNERKHFLPIESTICNEYTRYQQLEMSISDWKIFLFHPSSVRGEQGEARVGGGVLT